MPSMTKSLRVFFRREEEELVNHSIGYPKGLSLLARAIFMKIIGDPTFELVQLLDLEEPSFMGDAEETTPSWGTVETGYERRERMVLSGVALLKIGFLNDVRTALMMRQDQEGNVILTWLLRAEDEKALSTLLEWTQGLEGDVNPLRGQLLALTEGGSLEFLPPQETGRDDVIVPKETLVSLERDFAFLEHPDRYPLWLRRRAVLLAGEPGVGKTLACKWLAGALEVTTLWITPGAIAMSGPAAAFDIARRLRPALIILEDLDLASGDRSNAGLGDLLSQLDGFNDLQDIGLLATTNHPEVLDEALDPLRRPGRFHRLVRFERPTDALRTRMAGHLVGRSTVLSAYAGTLVPMVVEASAGMTGAQLTQLVNDLELDLIWSAGNGETPDPQERLQKLCGAASVKQAFGFNTPAAF